MTEMEIAEARGILSSKHHGELRKLFYQKNGLPKQGLYTKRQIFVKLKITEFKPNTLETEGLIRILGVSLAQLRKQAKEAKLGWLDAEIMQGGNRIARHGYNDDIDMIMSNADKFDGIADGRVAIAKDTRDIANRIKLAAS